MMGISHHIQSANLPMFFKASYKKWPFVAKLHTKEHNLAQIKWSYIWPNPEARLSKRMEN
jgi:hypothetical protein